MHCVLGHLAPIISQLVSHRHYSGVLLIKHSVSTAYPDIRDVDCSLKYLKVCVCVGGG